jgi:brefeldin A-resistance guanine nucleotide exchange factor 1
LKEARKCVHGCHPEQLITESKFLRIESLQELVKALIFASPRSNLSQNGTGVVSDEKATIFFLEILVKIVVQNR